MPLLDGGLRLPAYPASACCTAESTLWSGGNLTHPFFATIRSPTQTLNSPRSPSINSGSTPSSRLIKPATRAALGRYDAHILQNRMRTGFMNVILQTFRAVNFGVDSIVRTEMFALRHAHCTKPSNARPHPLRARQRYGQVNDETYADSRSGACRCQMGRLVAAITFIEG